MDLSLSGLTTSARNPHALVFIGVQSGSPGAMRDAYLYRKVTHLASSFKEISWPTCHANRFELASAFRFWEQILQRVSSSSG